VAPVRVVCQEADDAAAVLARATRAGLAAVVAREWFAGEDDHEDAVHVVTIDGDSAAVTALLAGLDDHDLWLEDDPEAPPTLPAAPPAAEAGGPGWVVDLPTGPRRGR